MTSDAERDLAAKLGSMVVEAERFRLENDQGEPLVFSGNLYAQTSCFDEASGVLTQQRLYTTTDGHQAFSVVTSDGEKKSRRAYLVRREGELCRIESGGRTVTLPYDSLMLYTQILWKLDMDAKSASAGEPEIRLAVNSQGG